jgi:hypothetical protein
VRPGSAQGWDDSVAEQLEQRQIEGRVEVKDPVGDAGFGVAAKLVDRLVRRADDPAVEVERASS